jgi:hypothetical protein
VPELDPDATIVIRRDRVDKPGRPAKAARGRIVAAAVAAVLAGAIGAGAALLLHTPHPGPVAGTDGTVRASRGAIPNAAPDTPLRDENEILTERADRLIVVRFRANPRILVLDFPDLIAQGMAFNRIAAFVEKQNLSHDRVLTNPELAAAISADNATVGTYYYGHDYRAADLQRFFATADRQGMVLERPEQDLRSLLGREGLLTSGVDGAVISIPREGSDPFVDASGRASLLRHELSHGEYFTNPAYADFVNRFWTTDMTGADRESFVGFLSRQGYDPKNADLMVNETQAHLVFTTDARYFNASACGLPAARIATLRAAFVAQMPAGWLHDAAMASLGRLP